MRPLAVLVLLAAPLFARPPEIPDFDRLEEVEARLHSLRSQLREEEEFRAKPREEKMILLFQRGEEKFETKRLTGESLIDELFNKWPEARKDEDEFTPQTIAILGLLPGALRERYYSVVPIPKLPRYKASRLLVKELGSKNVHLRRAAISCLEAIYGFTLMYDPEATPSRREAIRKKWQKEIDKLRR